MPDQVVYATGGLLTDNGQADLTAFASAGLFSRIVVIVVLPERELYALHRQLKLLSETRLFELTGLRVVVLYAREAEPEMEAADRNVTLMAGDRNFELITDEELTW